LDPDWIRIRIGIQSQTLDPDPDSQKMNMDPKPWFEDFYVPYIGTLKDLQRGQNLNFFQL
jgi:hypothetical protein